MKAEGRHEDSEILFGESFSFHLDCLRQFESTLGKSNHRVADTCHKLAEHHILRGEDAEAQ